RGLRGRRRCRAARARGLSEVSACGAPAADPRSARAAQCDRRLGLYLATREQPDRQYHAGRGRPRAERPSADGSHRVRWLRPAGRGRCPRAEPIARRLARLRGTLLPFLRAFDSPIAMARFRLVTFPPFPPLPLRRVPFFRRRMADSTSLLAPLLYLRPLDFFLAT